MEKNQKKKWLFLDASYIPLIIGALVTLAIVSIVYKQTQDILRERLRERITSIVSTAVLQIDPLNVQKVLNDKDVLAEAIDPLLVDSTSHFNKEEYQKMIVNNLLLSNHSITKLTQIMKKIREANNNMKYIYLLEPTEDSDLTKFITDSDTVIPVDWNENGVIDEIEYPPLPGEDYDISDVDVKDEILFHPVAAKSLYSDKWGSFLSGYAPVVNKDGKTIAILAIDVEVNDFTKLVNATLIPFSVLAIILLAMLAIQTVALVRIWGSRVEIFKELDRQKDELLSIVSHQLATPVSSVKWYLEMMLDGDMGKLTDDQSKHVKSMQSVVSDLADLVSMILDVSRIQLGRIKVNSGELNLNVFFNEILEVIKPKAEQKKVKMILNIPKNLPISCLDKRLMRMTLENLLSNAVKYSNDKAGEVTFKVWVRNSKLCYSVSDNGCGIPKEEQPKIFGKLFRASNVQNIDGNGFGLYAAKGAIEAQSGSISFISKEGNGTTFNVEVPLKVEKAN